MKNVCSIVIALMSFIIVNGQNTFPSSGNVGIGTSTSNSLLEIQQKNDPNSDKGLLITEPNNNVSISMHLANNTAGQYGLLGLGGKTIFRGSGQPSSFDGRVGIGTTNPRASLHVIGDFYLYGNNRKSGWNYTNFNWVGHTLIMGSPKGNYAHNVIEFKPGGSSRGELISVFNMYHALDEDTHENRISIHSSKEAPTFFNAGNVGIGTTTPDAKLAVNGDIHTKEIKVDLNGWADFVFKKDYNLPSLKQVEKHIQEKGHLANIPSAKEVAKNGVKLGEMNKKLLQKIEELTLYTIAQEKRIKNEEVRSKKQEERIKNQDVRLEALEKLVKNQSKIINQLKK